MPEFVLTKKLLDRALKNANHKRIAQVNLLIGPFSEEREDSIQFYWRDLAKGSYGEGAVLHFDHLKVEMKCLDCSGAFFVDENDKPCVCRYCCGEHLQLSSGEDVLLESIELE